MKTIKYRSFGGQRSAQRNPESTLRLPVNELVRLGVLPALPSRIPIDGGSSHSGVMASGCLPRIAQSAAESTIIPLHLSLLLFRS